MPDAVGAARIFRAKWDRSAGRLVAFAVDDAGDVFAFDAKTNEVMHVEHDPPGYRLAASSFRSWLTADG